MHWYGTGGMHWPHHDRFRIPRITELEQLYKQKTIVDETIESFKNKFPLEDHASTRLYLARPGHKRFTVPLFLTSDLHHSITVYDPQKSILGGIILSTEEGKKLTICSCGIQGTAHQNVQQKLHEGITQRIGTMMRNGI